MSSKEKITIESPVSLLPYAQKVEKLLNKLGIKTIRDLLLYPPSRYLDFSSIAKIKDVKTGGTFTVQGQIMSISNKRTWKRKLNITEAIIKDNTGSIKAIWFNQPFIAYRLKNDQFINISGKIAVKNTRPLPMPEIYFSSPAYEVLGKTELAHTGRVIPIYPETKGLTSRWIRFLMSHALKFAKDVPEILPPEIIKKERFSPVAEIVKNLHFPKSLAEAQNAKKQLAFQELFIVQLMILSFKNQIQSQNAPQIKIDIDLIKKFLSQLPFQLTDAQKKSAWQILQDMEKPHPMNRLLNGDVGSGKTIVATIATLGVAKQNWQTGYLAPTEILARQHFQTFCKFLQPFDLKIALATGSESKIFDPDLNQEYSVKKPDLIRKISSGEINIAIGTHALIQEKIKFSNLGLIIIDEQHRFGVAQRAALLKKRGEQKPLIDDSTILIPHLLSMTATPIPRTLMLTIFGDLDISIIDEMPKSRQKIITKIVLPAERKKTYDFIRQEVKNGKQVFVVCPRIEQTAGNEQQATSSTEVKAVKEEFTKLSEEIFPDLKIAMLHGKLKPKEKEKIMSDFKNNKINILVSTSVIEVGVDIPNATIMLIENADRFGLAQLHQFRGRIGRGAHQSYCLLMIDSDNKSENDRLQSLVETDNGFKLAEKDLDIRGPGEFVGSRQSGLPDLAFASFSADIFLLKKIKDDALKLLARDKDLKNYPLLKNQIENMRKKMHME